MLDAGSRYSASRPRSVLGQGLAFPPRVGPDGRLAWSSGEENVRQLIRALLLTEPGERLMREQYGCGLRQFLFEPNTPATLQLIRDRITRAIGRWEPRVALEAVEAEADPDDPRIVHITVEFRLLATQAVERVAMSLGLEG